MPEKTSFTIKPTNGLKLFNMSEVWAYRDLILMMVLRDLKSRYKQTALGPLWIIITPLVNALAYAIIFKVLARFDSGDIPYPLYTYVGLLAWDLIVRTMTGTVGSMRAEIALMAKVYYPRIINVFVYTLSNFVDFLVSFLVMFVLLAYYGIAPSGNIIYIPIFIFLAIFCAISLGVWFSGPCVKYRDIARVVPLFLSFFKFLAPVVFPAYVVIKGFSSFFPNINWDAIYYSNPFAFIVDGFKWCIFGDNYEFWINYNENVLISFIVILVFLIGGLFYFNKWSRTVVDLQ